MNPLLRKEIRMLMPAWFAALVTATMPLWVRNYFLIMAFLMGGAAVLALALSPFGQEASYGTFGLLLVQPKDRRRFWRIKTSLLALAMLSWLAVFTFCARATSPAWKDMAGSLSITALAAFVVFSGGLWSTILVRDMATAVFCTCLAPLVIYGTTTALVAHWISPDTEKFKNILYAVFTLYSVAGFWWARRLFLHAQDAPWTGGQISFKSGFSLSIRLTRSKNKRKQNRWITLIQKELQLQEVILIVIPLLIFLHLIDLAIYHFYPDRSAKAMLLKFVPHLWSGVVPLLIGCVAVAEERRLNTLESALCLPVSKRASFALKLAVTLVLGILLGGIVPWGLVHFVSFAPDEVRVGIADFEDFLKTATLITALAFYASTMSKGMLQAIPTTVCAFGVIITGMALGDRILPYPNVLQAVAITAIFIWQAFKNYKSPQVGWQMWIRNIVTVGVIYIGMLWVIACLLRMSSGLVLK